MYDAMEDIEVCPMSNIVDWDNYDTTGVRFVCCVESEEMTFLSDQIPRFEDDVIIFDKALILRLNGNRPGPITRIHKIHLRPDEVMREFLKETKIIIE